MRPSFLGGVDLDQLQPHEPRLAALHAQTQPFLDAIRQHSAMLQPHAANAAVHQFNRFHAAAGHTAARSYGARP